MERATKRTWAEISLPSLEHNYRALRGMLPRGCRFVGVVKADAYGHGAIPVAKKLEELGAEYLAVACLDEAIELRRAGIQMPILILGVTPAEFAGELLEHSLTQTVQDSGSARALSKAAAAAGKTLRVHIKADTGMSRLGFLCDEKHLDAAVAEIVAACALPGLEAEGIFTHFAAADGDEEYTMVQLTRFLDVTDKLAKRGVRFKIRHCAASAAVLNYPCTHLDMVRPGIALYGHYPDPACQGLDGPGFPSGGAACRLRRWAVPSVVGQGRGADRRPAGPHSGPGVYGPVHGGRDRPAGRIGGGRGGHLRPRPAPGREGGRGGHHPV